MALSWESGVEGVSLWNTLPQRAVGTESLCIYKAEIDRFLIRNRNKGFGERAGKWT